MRLRVLADYSTKHAMEVMRRKTGDPRDARERHRLLEALFHPLQRSTHALLMPPGGRRTYGRRHAANLRAKALNVSTFFAIPLAWCLHISTRLPSPEVDSTNRPEMPTWTQRGHFICETDNFDKYLHEAGIAVVILAMILDRITSALNTSPRRNDRTKSVSTPKTTDQAVSSSAGGAETPRPTRNDQSVNSTRMERTSR